MAWGGGERLSGGWKGGEEDDQPGFPGVRSGSPMESLEPQGVTEGLLIAELGQKQRWGAGGEGELCVSLRKAFASLRS